MSSGMQGFKFWSETYFSSVPPPKCINSLPDTPFFLYILPLCSYSKVYLTFPFFSKFTFSSFISYTFFSFIYFTFSSFVSFTFASFISFTEDKMPLPLHVPSTFFMRFRSLPTVEYSAVCIHSSWCSPTCPA